MCIFYEFCIFVSVHHIEFLRYVLHTYVTIVRNREFVRGTLLGCNENYTIRTTATIDSCCRSILQNFNRLNIVGVQVGKTTLHRNTIYYIERVATGVDGTYTTNANAYATLWVSARYSYLYTRHLTCQGLTEVGRRIVGKSLCLDRRHSSRYVALLLHAITYNHNFFQYLIIICQVYIDYFATIYLDVLVLAANV